MDGDDTRATAVTADSLARLIEADREGRASRIFTRSSVAGPTGAIGRAVAYRIGTEIRSMVFRVEGHDGEIVVDLDDLLRVERV